MLASDHVENLAMTVRPTCAQGPWSLGRGFAFCNQSYHNRAANVCRSLMVGHHCQNRQGQNRTVKQSVKANGVPSRGRPRHLGSCSPGRSYIVSSTRILHMFIAIYYLQQYGSIQMFKYNTTQLTRDGRVALLRSWK